MIDGKPCLGHGALLHLVAVAVDCVEESAEISADGLVPMPADAFGLLCVVDRAARLWQLRVGESLIGRGSYRPRSPAPPIEEFDEAGAVEDVRGRLRALGLEPIRGLHTLDDVRTGRDRAVARIRLNPGATDPAVAPRTLLEASLQLVHCLNASPVEGKLPTVSVDGYWGCGSIAPGELSLHVVRVEPSAFDAHAVTDDGQVVLALRGVRLISAARAVVDRRQVHETVMRTLREILEHANLDANTPLLDAGMRSLDLIRVMSSLERELGAHLSLKRAATCVTGEELSALVASASAESAPEEPTEPGASASAPDRAELSHAERRLWFLERFTQVAPAYNESVAWEIVGPIMLESVEAAIEELVARHPILRTRFPFEAGRPVRVVETTDATETSIFRVAPVVAADLPRAMRDEVARPIDVERGPLFRAVMHECDDGRRVLQLVAHHIACDRWSLSRVVAPQLAEFYAALRAGAPLPVGSVAMTMSDYALRECRPEAEALRRAQQSWWRHRLHPAPPALDLPTDGPRPPVQAHRGARVGFAIGDALAARLLRRAAALRVTPFSLYLAAYRVLLHRHRKQLRLAIAVPVSLRDQPELVSCVGCLINMLPVIIPLRGTMTLEEVVLATQDAMLESLDHRHVPFEDLVKMAGGARSLAHGPLTQTIFSFDELDEAAPSFPGAEVRELEVHNGASKFDVGLEVRCWNGKVRCAFEYDRDIFAAARVEQMAVHYVAILDRLATAPDARVDGTWMLHEAELEQLRALGSGPDPRPRTASLLSMIDAALRRDSEAIAAVAGQRRISRSQLAIRVAALANRLESELESREGPVAICTGRGVEWIIAMLAVGRCGMTYLPIDRRTPPSRAIEVACGAGARALVFVPDACAWWRAFPGSVLPVSMDAEGDGGDTATSPGREGPAMYAITTSGSTGRPKTAAVTRAAFGDLVRWYVDELSLSASDVVVVATSTAFDLTQKNVFGALVVGATVVLHVPTVFDPVELLEQIREASATVLNCTPTMLELLVRAAESVEGRPLSSLRAVVLGGEPVDPELINRWPDARQGGVRILNTYGPTECTDVVVWHDLGSVPVQGPVPLGRPLPGVRVDLLDDSGRPVPRGDVGEITLSGACVGLGYLEPNADMSAFDSGPAGTQRYRTGDLGWWDWNGRLHFAGRKDTQVKLHGYRLEPADVERACLEHSKVLHAGVSVRKHPSGDRFLCAHLVWAGEVQTAELRRFLAERLPPHMVPSRFESVERLPMTESGKLDRGALAIQALAEPEWGEVAANDAEREVLDGFSAVLGEPVFDPCADFFAIGGHSLLAIKLAEHLRREHGRLVSVRDIFRHSTARALASALESES
ncbi:MAG: condensation domain-containing protein [Myxococcales bacterium]